MTLPEIKATMDDLEALRFVTPDGNPVPEHFHVTEVGLVRKTFIDCGGTSRDETKVSFQLWFADDYDHRLSAEKLRSIIELAEDKLEIDPDLEVEVEYQGDTIGRYGLEFDGTGFQLTAMQTDCLAKDKCGITPSVAPVPTIQFAQTGQGDCPPNSGCC